MGYFVVNLKRNIFAARNKDIGFVKSASWRN